VKGIDLRKVRDVIVSCFDADEFDQFLRFEFDLVRAAKIKGDTLDDIVFNTLTRAEMDGWLPNLIAAVARERPRRDDVQATYHQYAAALVSEASQAQIDEAVARAYGRFFGDRPPVSLQTGGAKEALVPARDPGLEKTLSKELGFLDAAVWYGTFGRMQRRIAQVELNDPDDTKGTAFLVGPDAVLTAYHVVEKVIKKEVPAAGVKVRFDYRTGPSPQGVEVKLAGATQASMPWLLAHSPYSPGEAAAKPDRPPPKPGELDYALLKLARPVGSEATDAGPRGWIDVPSTQPPVVGLPMLLILQHPMREPLQLALDTHPRCALVHDGRRVRYWVNTEGGSSGAPVFDKDWKLVALHHYGDPAWVKPPEYNQGVPIGLIRADLKVEALAALGPPAGPVPHLEVASAVANALHAEFQTGEPDREKVVAIASQRAAAVLSRAVTMSETVRRVIDGKLGEITGRWEQGMTSDRPTDWQRATDRLRADVCALLKLVKQVNGGVLPDDLYQVWADNGCA